MRVKGNFTLCIATILMIGTFCLISSCRNNKQDSDSTRSKIEQDKEQEDIRVTYITSDVESGWVALYDTEKGVRCYMSHGDYYSIKKPNMSGNLKENYSHLIPLGMVLKYSGAKIIWGFEGVEGLNWKDSKNFVDNYSPDGKTWRLLSKIRNWAIAVVDGTGNPVVRCS